MKSAINFRNKKTVLFIPILALIAWLFIRPKTPQEQVIGKYIKEKSSNSCTLTMIVRKKDIMDPNYGALYTVNGVIGDFADVNFFYLKEDSDGWKVVTCGTGP